MALQVRFEIRPDHVKATVTGDCWTYDDAMAYIDTLVAECGRTGLHQLLVDEREARHHEGITIATAVAEHLFHTFAAAKVHRVSSVLSAYSWPLGQVFALLARNRGIDTRVFLKLAAAEAWLQEHSRARAGRPAA